MDAQKLYENDLRRKYEYRRTMAVLRRKMAANPKSQIVPGINDGRYYPWRK